MSKKKLPKAIRPTADEMREAAAGRGASRSALPRAGRFGAPADAGAAARDVGRAGISTGGAGPFAAVPVRPRAARPPSRCGATTVAGHAIVERHAAYSVVGGIIPLPIVNVASVTAIIVRMVKVLSELYGVPFERDRARAIVIGLMGGIMPTGVAAVTASTLLYVIPGSNLIGLAMSSVSRPPPAPAASAGCSSSTSRAARRRLT